LSAQGGHIPRSELFPESVFKGDPDFVQEGCVTDEGICELRKRMPYADLATFGKDRWLGCVSDVFTVGMLTRYITWKLEKKAVEVGGK
jgi:acyl carrier protein